MTSNNSIYKMIREHLRHNAWMFWLSAIGSILFGPIFFMFAIGGENFENYALRHTTEEFYQYVSMSVINDLSNCTMMLVVIATIGAAIVGFGIFSYLFQPRKIDLYHSLPVTRKEMFWASYLSGLLIWVIPFLIGALLTFISAFIVLKDFSSILSVLLAMFHYLLYPTLGFFIIYHLCLVGIMLSGNLANAVVSTGVWGLSVVIIYGLLILYAEAFFDTYYDAGNAYYIAYALSPITAPFVLMAYNGAWDWIYAATWLITLFLAVLNLFVAYRIHKKRKSELAGHGMDNKFASLSIRICVSIILGLLGVIPLYLFGYSMESRPMWMLLFNGLFAAIAYAIATAIQKRSVKAFFTHKIQMAVVTVCSVGIAAIYIFDVFGYDDYLPREGSVESMEIDINAFDEYYYYGSNFEGYPVTDSNIIDSVLKTAVNTPTKEHDFSILVKVSPKFGFDYYRRYYMSYEETDVLRPIVETESYMNYRLEELISNQDRINSIHVYAVHNTTDIDSTNSVQKIIDAYIQDSRQLLTLEQQAEYLVMCTLSFRVYTYDGGYNHIIEVPITPEHTNTIRAIQQANESIVCTQEQMDIQEVTISVSASNTTLEDALYVELLPYDELTYSEAYEEMYGSKPGSSTNEGAVVIQTTSEYRSGSYSHTFRDEELKWLMPYIHLAQSNRDGFNQNNYSYMGTAIIQYNQHVDVYIKRGDMSKEEILKLASYLQLEQMYY